MAYSRTRARDADRAKAIDVLAAAFADGQLSRAEHDARVNKLHAARTFADLDEQLFDLQKPGEHTWQAPAGSEKPSLASGRQMALKIATMAALMAVVMGVFLPQLFDMDSADVPNGGVNELVAEPPSEPAPIKDPRTAEGYAAFVKEMQAKLKTTKMTRASLHEDSVSVTLPVSPDKGRRYVTWSWDGEWTESSTGKYSDSDEVWLLDLKDVDGSTFSAALDLAFGRVEDPESASLAIDPDGKICYTVYVDNRFDESFYGRFGCNGKLIKDS